MSAEGKRLFWCFVAIVVVGAVVYVGATSKSGGEVETNWHNALAGCHRTNPKWKAYTRAVEAQAKGAPTMLARQLAYESLVEIRSQPAVRHDGTTICAEAYPKP